MFANAVTLCTLKGFTIKVDPSWLIIAALVTWSLSRGYFPQVLPDQSPAVYLIAALAATLGFFGSLVLHELAHSLVARRLGVGIRSITLFVFGGVAELETEPPSASAEFRIAVAGPLMSLALAAAFRSLAQIGTAVGIAPVATQVLAYLALINAVLALFNLVPAFPLDGGRVLRAYLWHRTGDALAATRVAARSGAFFAYALMVVGVMALFQGAFGAGLWYLLIGAFILMAARASFGSQLAKTVFDHKTVAQMMCTAPITASPDMTLAALVNQVMLRHHVSFVPVIESGVLLGHIDTAILSGIDRENWANTQVGDVFAGLDQAAMIDPDTAIRDLLQIIGTTGRRKFMVVRDHRLLGVITLSDLTAYMSRPPSSHPHPKGLSAP